ncbi:hypothetical protein IAU60_001955 [Kwoniella sp. DSM 27419]
MRPSLLLRATHTHQPMIKFLGQRKNIPHAPHAPAPHPCAPVDIVDHFQSFLAKLQSTSGGPENPSSNPKAQTPDESAQGKVKGGNESSAGLSGTSNNAAGSGGADASQKSSKPVDFENFWEAPGYLWTPKEVTEREIESVMSGGATDVRSGP